MQAFDSHAPVPACDIEQARMVLSGWRFMQRAVVGPRDARNVEMAYPFEQPEILARVLDDPKRPRFELRRFHRRLRTGRPAGRIPASCAPRSTT